MAGACVSQGVSAQTGLTLAGTQGGVTVAQQGDERTIAFGSAKRATLSAIQRIVGVKPRQIPCPAPQRDAYITPQGMVTVYEGDRFVGWRKISRTEGAPCS